MLTRAHRLAWLALLLLTQPALARPLSTHGNPLSLLPPAKTQRLVFGVMGSAAPEATIPPEVRARIEGLGRAIARQGGVVLTGACPGMPQVAARAAKLAGGFTVGISPAGSLREHTKVFKSPTEAMDVIKMTGAGAGMGLIARERDNIGLSNILVFAGGRSGTLGELIFAMQEPRVVALLEGSTGVTEKARQQILPIIGRGRAVVVADSDPDRLIAKAVRAEERLRQKEASRAARDAGSTGKPWKGMPPTSTGPVLGEADRLAHNVVSFFGSSRGMSAVDRDKVRTLAELISTRRPGGRDPLLVLPTRRGLATDVAQVARRHGVRTVGVSPASSREEHRGLEQLSRGLSEIRLTGEGGGIGKLAAYKHSIKPADVVFVAGGDHETLGGAIFAMYEPTVVAVLETGGMTGKLRSHILSTFDKPTVAHMVYDTDPQRLYRRAMAEAAVMRQTQQREFVGAE